MEGRSELVSDITSLEQEETSAFQAILSEVRFMIHCPLLDNGQKLSFTYVPSAADEGNATTRCKRKIAQVCAVDHSAFVLWPAAKRWTKLERKKSQYVLPIQVTSL